MSWVVWQLVRQLLHSVSVDNNLVLSHLWGREIMVKGERASKYFVRGCKKNFLFLSFFLIYAALIQFEMLVLANYYPNLNYEIVLFEKCKMYLVSTSQLLQILILTTKMAFTKWKSEENIDFKASGTK